MSFQPVAYLIHVFLSSGVLTLSSLCQIFDKRIKILQLDNKIHRIQNWLKKKRPIKRLFEFSSSVLIPYPYLGGVTQVPKPRNWGRASSWSTYHLPRSSSPSPASTRPNIRPPSTYAKSRNRASIPSSKPRSRTGRFSKTWSSMRVLQQHPPWSWPTLP